MDGYKEAEKIDVLINKLANEQPPFKGNALEWLRFTRTLISSLRILRSAAEEALGI